jgi:4-hydroxy-tetrahydrodipicolinate synthase|tara:strand:- start:5324 stop:6220 length:897 start_codon:yes stop_codon:yes gene_type:complete
MNEINGIYAATLSILDKNLSLDINKTINHADDLLNNGCHGVVFLGSTGQAQLISISEKINLINELSKRKLKKKYIIGTGLNSLSENINLMKISIKLGFNIFLIMPPAYYKYGDEEVINYYSKLVENIPDSKIILYNFEKLCGYKFSKECVTKLVEKFPKQIVGVKDSSYNLFRELKINNFSIFPGSETKLLDGLRLGCKGIITATCNVTAPIARKVYDDFYNNKEQTFNNKLCNVREVFEKFNLISGLHTFLSQKDENFKNLLPTLNLLRENDRKKLIDDLDKLDFNISNLNKINEFK